MKNWGTRARIPRTPGEHPTPREAEKAELASDEYLPLSTLIEGVVILRKNPNHVPETKTEKKK